MYYIVFVFAYIYSESQIRVRSDGRGWDGVIGRTVDHGAAATHMQVPRDRRRKVGTRNCFRLFFFYSTLCCYLVLCNIKVDTI